MAVHDVEYETFRALLAYLLTDEPPDALAVQPLLDLMMLSNAYGVVRLEQLCARTLTRVMSEQDAREVSRCAGLIGSGELMRAASSFSDLQKLGGDIPLEAR